MGADTYDLKYSAEIRLIEVRKNNTVIATFTYDGDGKQVKSVVNGVTTYLVGAHYHVENGQVTKYYFAGAQRVAVRKNGTLSYLLTDHLGSTLGITNTSGTLTAGTLYKAWGETRYTLGTVPTKFKYTGQREESALGLYFYNARWYDSTVGRFVQADTVVPNGIQGLDRYAYVNSSPLNFVDPTGHFTEDAIEKYLRNTYGKNWKDYWDAWSADEDWWDMLLAAQAGDVLYGTVSMGSSAGGAVVAFGFTFEGEGIDVLAGITPVGGAEGMAGITLNDIQQGHGKSVGYDVTLTWMGLYRESRSPQDSFPYTRPGYEPEFVGTPNEAVRTETKSDAMLLGILACATTRSFVAVVGCAWAVDVGEENIFDWLNIEEHDYQVNTGPVVFTLQLESGSSAMWNIEEIAWWSTVR